MTLQEEWKKYRDAIYPDGVSAIQNRETHQAFFAGAMIMATAMAAAATMTDEQGAEFLGKKIDEAIETSGLICQQMKDRN